MKILKRVLEARLCIQVEIDNMQFGLISQAYPNSAKRDRVSPKNFFSQNFFYTNFAAQ